MAEEHKVTPERWTPRGEVVVSPKQGHRPLIVWGGIPGEEARVRVVHRGRNQALGIVVEPLRPDPHRVGPPCDRFDVCGGCPLMHLDAEGQRLAHQAMVRQALDGEGLSDVTLGAHHGSPDGLEDFRHVVKLGVGYSDNGRIKVGAWGRRNRSIVPIPRCHVASPALRRVMASLAHHIIEMNIRPYEPAEDRGVLRAAVLRSSRTTGEVLVTLVAGRRIRELTELAEAVGQSCGEVVGIWLHLNDEPGNAIYSADDTGRIGVIPLLGKGWIEEKIGDVTYRVGPGDFFQTNPSMAQTLYQRAVERLDPGAEDAVVDLYCGVGGLALQAASRAGYVVGVEEVDGAVTRAREAARQNRLNAEFLSGRVQDVLGDLSRRLAGVRPRVSVNPARRGLEDDVVDQIVALQPSRVAYISCNPRALARDLVRFRAGGMRIGEVELFEMFPNSAHVECLVTLDGPDDGGSKRRAPRRKVLRG